MVYDSACKLFLDAKHLLSSEFNINVYEVKASAYSYGQTELLSTLGIQHQSIINFSTTNDNELVKCYGCSKDVKAWVTYFIANDLTRHAVVFIIDDFLFESDRDDSSEESEIEDVYICKYISLLHEFGHVKDFINQQHIRYADNKPSVDLVRSEAFADNFALRKMKNSSEPLVKYARKVMAKSVIKRKHENDFCRQVYMETIKLFNEEKLIQWAES